jgi:hypothetical protein
MRDTIDMARKVYGAHTEWTDSQLERLEQLVALVRADERAAQPAVPDAFGTRKGEHPEYIQGWNDCRAETLKMRKP